MFRLFIWFTHCNICPVNVCYFWVMQKPPLSYISTLLSEWLVDERDKCSLLQVQLVLFICSSAGNEFSSRSQGEVLPFVSPIQHTHVVINDDDDDDFEATAGKFVVLVT